MKLKMKNLGVKRQTAKPIEVPSDQGPEYPKITLSTKHFPDINNAQRGKKHMLSFVAHCSETQDGEDWGSKKGARATFELQKGTMDAAEEKPKQHGYRNISEASFGARTGMKGEKD